MDRIRAGIHRATHTGPGCSCDPLRAELDAGHSMDRIRAGIHRATHTGPGCSFDPLRAGTRCSSLDGSAAGRGFGVIIDSWPGWSFIERSTHNRRFCNRGTSCNKTPPVLQSRYIERHTPGRVAVAIRCGPGLDAVHSMDPLRTVVSV